MSQGTPSRTARWELAWCAALAVLIVNDHVLKGSGLLSPVVTGKLSDFAGLFVAPVLLAVVLARLGFPGVSVRVVAFAAVGAVFSAIKLSEAAARALEAFVSLSGVSWKVWSDPSDLLGLAVFPAAFRAARALAEETPTGPRRAWHSVAVIVGALGCLATSNAGPYLYSTSTYLWNATRDRTTVVVWRTRVPLDCGDLASSARSLGAEDLEPTFCASLVAGQVVPLDRDFEGPVKESGPAESEPPCDAVVIQASGLSDTLVFWRKTTNAEVPREQDAESWEKRMADPNGVVLEQVGGTWFAAGSVRIEVADYSEQLPAISCGELPSFDQLDPDRAVWERE